MIMTLTTGQIADALRADQGGGWSYNGARVLAEHLEETEYEEGATLSRGRELDVIEIRCEWTEYVSAVEALRDMGLRPTNRAPLEDEDEDEDEAEDEAMSYLTSIRQVVAFPGGVLVS